MNIHTSHVTPIHTLSTIRHYSFPLAGDPVNCYVAHNITIYMCYIDSFICFVDLNFFFYIFQLQCFHWRISFSTIFVMFIFRFILFMFGPTCASNITFDSLVVIIVSAQNGSVSCQTHALHCMLISHGLLYMVMSKGLHVTYADVFHTCNWTMCCMYWTGVSGANVTIRLSEAPVRLHYTCPYTIHCTQIGRVLKTPLFQLIVVMKELE